MDLNLEPFESQIEFKLYSKEKGKVSQDLDQLKLPKLLCFNMAKTYNMRWFLLKR